MLAENRAISGRRGFWGLDGGGTDVAHLATGDSPVLGEAMVKGALLGLSLLLHAAFEPHPPQPESDAARGPMSPQGKNALIQPLMHSATDCIVRAVSGDPKFQASIGPAELNMLIVASMESCVEEMRAMIEAHDRLFGEGSGEAFFMGPYLEILPKAVSRQVKRILP